MKHSKEQYFSDDSAALDDYFRGVDAADVWEWATEEEEPYHLDRTLE